MTETGFNDQFNDPDALRAMKNILKDRPYEILQGLRNSVVDSYHDFRNSKVDDAHKTDDEVFVEYRAPQDRTKEEDHKYEEMSMLVAIIDVYLVPMQYEKLAHEAMNK